MRAGVVVCGERDLFEIVLALHPGCRIPHPLDGREQQTDQDGDDRHHDDQLEQCESAAPIHALSPGNGKLK